MKKAWDLYVVTLYLFALFVLLGSCWQSRYRSCMEKRHDEVLCEIYARGR